MYIRDSVVWCPLQFLAQTHMVLNSKGCFWVHFHSNRKRTQLWPPTIPKIMRSNRRMSNISRLSEWCVCHHINTYNRLPMNSRSKTESRTTTVQWIGRGTNGKKCIAHTSVGQTKGVNSIEWSTQTNIRVCTNADITTVPWIAMARHYIHFVLCRPAYLAWNTHTHTHNTALLWIMIIIDAKIFQFDFDFVCSWHWAVYFTRTTTTTTAAAQGRHGQLQ